MLASHILSEDRRLFALRGVGGHGSPGWTPPPKPTQEHPKFQLTQEAAGGGGGVPGGRMGKVGGGGVAGDWKGGGALTYSESTRRSNPNPNPNPKPKANHGMAPRPLEHPFAIS